MTTSKMIESLKDYDTVSFDVFDTLLLRPYVEPTDLFYHMETNEKIPGFAKARIRAERVARSKIYPEVTLSEIYDTIDASYKECMDTELKYETQILQQNAEMKKVYDFALSVGKRVVLVSDMYLPSDFMEKLLKNKGFDGFDRLYVSCEHRKNKHSGSLFEHVLKDLDLTPNVLLHIGDNRISDVRTPERMGIGVIQYEKVINRYFKQHKRERLYYRMKRNWERSLIVGMDSLYKLNFDSEKSFWYNFGFRYGGPVTVAFASFINKNTKNDDVLLFIARDGYNAHRAYNLLYGNVENHYVYAVRLFNIFFGINEKDYPGYEEEIVRYFANKEETKDFSGASEKIFYENLELYRTLMDDELKKYGDYLDKFLKNKENICVVDVSTMKFSAQKLIEKASGKNVKGIYYTLMNSKSNDEVMGFVDDYYTFLEYTQIDVPEFLMTSGESPIIKLNNDGLPIYYATLSSEEWYRGDVTSEIEKGIEDYALFTKNVFGNLLPSLDSNTVNKWVLSLARRMDPEERSNLGKIKWASDPAHSEYHGLIFSPSDAPMLIRNKTRDYYRSMINRLSNKKSNRDT